MHEGASIRAPKEKRKVGNDAAVRRLRHQFELQEFFTRGEGMPRFVSKSGGVGTGSDWTCPSANVDIVIFM
jgi:hypothetical protein